MFHVKQSGKAVTNKCSSTIWNRAVTWLFTNICIVASVTISHTEKVEPGQKLPSKRALAKQLGVSLITVEAAYDQLVAEGYIRSRERCGYYACDLAPAAKIEEPGSAQHRTKAANAVARRERDNHAANPNNLQLLSQEKERPENQTGHLPTTNPGTQPAGSTAAHAQNTPSDAPLSQISRTARWQPPCSPTPLGRKPSAERFRTNRRHRWPKPLLQQDRPSCEAPSPTICGNTAGWTCRLIRSP